MRKTILFIDDEAEIRNSIRRLLRKEPYEVLFASSADEALDLMAGKTVNLVITDHKMPGTSGVDFLGLVKKRWPEVVRLLISGYIETDLLIEAINKGEIYRFITKPWENDKLRQYISEGLRHYDILEENRHLMEKIIDSGFFKSVQDDGRGASAVFTPELDKELDYGVLILDKDLKVIRMNKKCLNYLNSKTVSSGLHIYHIFGKSICAFIENGFRDNDGQAAEQHEIDGRMLTFRVRSFRRREDSEKGLVIIHE